MSNRLLQNYLDLSLPSKKSSNSLKQDENDDDSLKKTKNLIKKKEFNSKLEINRIPSERKKNRYSVATVATQADMSKNTIIAERTEIMYRNQESSDVESQILSIEVQDKCNDQYSSITSDLKQSITMNGIASIKIDLKTALKNSLHLNKNQQKDSIFDLYNIDQTTSSSIIQSSECKSLSDFKNKLVFRFSKSITDDHLKLETNDFISNQSVSQLVPFDLQMIDKDTEVLQSEV
jgi:hypothetical protein